MSVNKNHKKPGDRNYPVNKYLSRAALLLTLVLVVVLVLFTNVHPVQADENTYYTTGVTDGYIFDNNGAGAGVVWAVLIGQPGNSVEDSGGDSLCGYVRSDSGSGDWRYVGRSFYSFDTSDIPVDAEITDAVLSVYGRGKSSSFSVHSWNLNVYEGTPADPESLVPGDFDAVLDTKLCDTAINYSVWNVAGYNDWTLNGDGLDVVNTAGFTTLTTRMEYDASGDVPAWEASKILTMQSYDAEHGSNKPRLVVTFTLPPPAGPAQPPSNFQVVRVGVSTANLSWVSGNGTGGVEIWVSMDGYPWQSGTGYELYSGANVTYQADGLPEFITYYFTAWGTSSGNLSANVTDAELTGVDMDVNLAVDGSLVILGVACFLLLVSIFLKKMLIYIALFLAWLMVIVTVNNMYLDSVAGIVMIFAVVQFLKARKGVEV